MDDENEVQEITAASTPMKNNRPVCVIFNQTYMQWKHICNGKLVSSKYPGEHMILCKPPFPL